MFLFPPANRQLLEDLFVNGGMAVERSSLFDESPPPLPERVDWERIEGMLLGIAVGDALGAPTESMSAEERRRFFLNDIADYYNFRRQPEPTPSRGFPTDDTQLSFWLLEQLLRDDGLIPENVARLFVERGDEIRGRGRVTSRFLVNARQTGLSWEHWAPAEEASGNGSLMRIAPIIVPHLKTCSAELWVDTALAARITHNDSASISSCLALVTLIWQCLGRSSPPAPEWWLDEYLKIATPLERQHYEPRAGVTGIAPWKGRVVDLLEQYVRPAFARNLSVADVAGKRGWGSGAYLLETVPSVIYILMKHGHSFEEGVLRAVNDTRDNDTLAAIVGAVLGALHGKKAIPKRWITGLTGRTRADDDGQVFQLIEMARQRWG